MIMSKNSAAGRESGFDRNLLSRAFRSTWRPQQASVSLAAAAPLPRNRNPGKKRMIKKFHVLYVGQIELDNVGLSGTPANERHYSDTRLAGAFFTARDVAQLMDELG